jgi:hypothetical protein
LEEVSAHSFPPLAAYAYTMILARHFDCARDRSITSFSRCGMAHTVHCVIMTYRHHKKQREMAYEVGPIVFEGFPPSAHAGLAKGVIAFSGVCRLVPHRRAADRPRGRGRPEGP